MCSRFRIELAVLALIALTGCSNGMQAALPAQQPEQPGVIDSALAPGVGHGLVTVDPRAASYIDNPQAVVAGKKLFSQYNCSGCHSNGGGGMGPSLMDDEWIYGGRLEQIHQTLVEGRPNGMPSWGGKIPDQQLWQLSAYVRSMSVPATLAAQTGPIPSQTPAALPRDVDQDAGQDAGWSPAEDATNHYTTTTKGPQ